VGEPNLISRNPGKLQEYSPQDLGLSLELPGSPIKVDMALPDTAHHDIKQRKTYIYNDQKIGVFATRLVSDKLSAGPSSLKDMAAGFLDSLAKRPGISDVVKMVELKDDSTLMTRATFKDRGTYFEERGSLHIKGNSAWIIAITFVLGDEQATELSMQIINSVKFE